MNPIRISNLVELINEFVISLSSNYHGKIGVFRERTHVRTMHVTKWTKSIFHAEKNSRELYLDVIQMVLFSLLIEILLTVFNHCNCYVQEGKNLNTRYVL